jgi:hypothetical protein
VPDSDAGRPQEPGGEAPELLSRLSDEFDIPPHQARQWVRDWKLGIYTPLPPEAMTRTGRLVRGRIAVPVSQRPTWEALCKYFYAFKGGKALTQVSSTAEKKKAYREALKLNQRCQGWSGAQGPSD